MSESIKNPGALLRLNFVIALSGMLGSLYFSEVMNFPPCSLCWYQRMCIYPLVVIFGAALFTDDHAHHKYSLTLIAIGLILAIYHNLLYYGLIAKEIVPCTSDVSCSSRQLELFGFITIPLLSLVSLVFMFVIGCFEFRAKHNPLETV